MWDSSIQGYRLKKRSRGCRYNEMKYHKSEGKLAKIIESYYGASNVFVSFMPLWAVSPKNVLYEYDILIKDKKILVEYNGIGHYKFTPFFHKTERKFRKQLENDKAKARLAKENGYILISFRYDEPMFKDYVIDKIEKFKENI